MSKQKTTKPPKILENAARFFKNEETYFIANILPILKFFNYGFFIIFLFSIVLGLKEEVDFKSSLYIWVIIFCLSPILANLIISWINKHHEFFEWDKRERRKKKTFISTLNFLVYFFSYLSLFYLTTAINELPIFNFTNLDKPDTFVLTMRFGYGILFLINAIFPVKLHYSLFKVYLNIDYHNVVSKPENWDKEINDKPGPSDFY